MIFLAIGFSFMRSVSETRTYQLAFIVDQEIRPDEESEDEEKVKSVTQDLLKEDQRILSNSSSRRLVKKDQNRFETFTVIQDILEEVLIIKDTEEKIKF